MAGCRLLRGLRSSLVLAGVGTASLVASLAAANDLLRHVDPVSGRPLIPGCSVCRRGVSIFARATQLSYQEPDRPATPSGPIVFESGDPDAALAPGVVAYWDALAPMMGGLGVGTDPGCLRAAGVPRFGRVDFSWEPVDLDGDTSSDPIDSIDDHPPQEFASLDGFAPELFRLRGFRARPPYAEFDYANQQLFSFLCLGTVSIAGSVDGSACAWTVFGSPNTLAVAGAPILSEVFAATFAGDPSRAIAGPLGLLQGIQLQTRGSSEFPVPIRPANSDLRDGVMTSFGSIFINNPGTVPPGSGQRAYNPDGIQYPLPLANEAEREQFGYLLSLDSVFSAEQRALLGCGPFFGTRCDSSRLDRVAQANFPPGTGVGFPEGGGIDLLNTEMSALLLAAPGTVGTSAGWTTNSRTLTATSTEPLIQPGTIGFVNDSYCSRYDPSSELANDFGLVRLPGCRGISQMLTPSQDLAGLAPTDPIKFLFEKGYTPQLDGCVLGVSNPSNADTPREVAIDGHPVKAFVPIPGTPVDPNNPEGTALEITGELNETCGGAAAARASLTRIAQPNYLGPSLARNFAQTAWHPLAGCKTFAQAHDPSDAVRRCDFTPFDPITNPDGRDFESEFIEGTAQIFRSEIAAISWNFLTFLVVTSCDSVTGGDDLSDPDCFNPGTAPWAPDRCSLAAPQLCRNVQPLLEATADEDGDGVPDVLEAEAPCALAQPSRAVLWPPHRDLVAIELDLGEELDGAAIEVTGVTQDERPGKRGARHAGPNARIDGDRVWLRAERSGSGNGRVYRVSYTASRPIPGSCAAATSCTGSVSVCVPHGRKSRCRDDGQRWDATAR